MLNLINGLVEKVQSKTTFPSDKQLQTSHFSKIADQFNELNHACTNSTELSQNAQKIIGLLQNVLNYQFPLHTHYVLSNSVSMWIVAMYKVEAQWIGKCLDIIIQQLNKKGIINKSITLNVFVTLCNVGHDVPNMPYQVLLDIGNVVLKLLKSSDVQIRIMLTKTFKLLNINQFSADILKYAIKFANQDKSEPLRDAGYIALITLMKQGVSLTQHYEIILQLAFKLDTKLHYRFFKYFLFQQQSILIAQATPKKQDKNYKAPAPLTEKEKITRIFSLLNENLTRVAISQMTGVFQSYLRYLTEELSNHGQVIVRGAFEVATSCISRIPSDDPNLYAIYKQSSALCVNLIHKLSINNRKDLLDYFLDKLQKKQSKNQIYIAKMLLNGLNVLVDTMGSNIFDEKRSKPVDILQHLQSIFQLQDQYLKPMTVQQPQLLSVFKNIYLVIQSLFLENVNWQHHIISVLLNYVKINMAELTTQPDNQAVAQALGTQCICLAMLLKQLETNLHSVPHELTNNLWEIAKSFIKKQKNSHLKRSGWVVVAELMVVSYFASQGKLKEVLVLIQEAFDTKENDLDCMRCIGLVSISLTTGPLQKQLSDNMRKFLAQQLIIFFQQFPQMKNERGITSAKMVFFWALRMLNPKHYSSHINNLVQMSVDDILISSSAWEVALPPEPIQKVDESRGEAICEFTMAQHTCKFLGLIMATSSFTPKNKLNFIKYMASNMQTLVTSKGYARLQAYLYCLLMIAQKLAQNGSESNEFNEQIFQMCDLCWNCDIQCIQELVAQVYSTMLQVTQVNTEELLNKLLSTQQNPNGTLVYLIKEMLNRQIPNVELQIQNLFMKVVSHIGLVNEEFNVAALSMLEQVSTNLLKGSMVFLVFSLMRDNPSNMNYKIITHYLSEGGQINHHFYTLYYACRCQFQNKQFIMVSLNFWMHHSKVDALLPMMEKSIHSNKLGSLLEQAQLYKQGLQTGNLQQQQQIIGILNKMFSIQRVQSTQLDIDTRHIMKQIFMALYTDDVSQIQQFIMEEFIPNSTVQVEDKSDHLVATEAIEIKIPIHIKTRIFLLKRLHKLFLSMDLQSNYQVVFEFLFKVTTSNYEEIKEMSFSLFHYFFKGLYKNNKEVLRNYAAQIDSILSDTIRRDNQLLEVGSDHDHRIIKNNTPEVNILNMVLISKFFKIVHKTDTQLGIKLINLLAKPLLNSKKLVPNQFYGEKFQFNQLMQRVISLGKILNIVQGSEEEYFNHQTLNVIQFYTDGLMNDIFILLCTPRTHIRVYKNFNFVYNGKKTSYDVQFIHRNLYKLLKQCKQTSNIQLSLIGYVLTQQTSLEQIEHQYKKWAQTLPIDVVKFSNHQKSKGIELLLKALNKPTDAIVHAMFDLLTLIIEVSLQHKSITIALFNQLSKLYYQNSHGIQALYGAYLQPIIITVQQLYIMSDNQAHKLTNVETLINLISGNEELERIAQTIWNFLITQQYEYDDCKKLLSSIKQIQLANSELSSLASDALSRLVYTRIQDYYLLLCISDVLESIQQVDQLREIVLKHFNQCLQLSTKILNYKKCIDNQIVQTLIPAIQQKLIDKDQQYFLDIIKFLLLVYILESNKQFIGMSKLMLLFIDPNFNAAIAQSAQQALKHMVSITHVDTTQLPPKLGMIVCALQNQIQKENQDRLNQESAKSQVKEGTIKLKQFGMK